MAVENENDKFTVNSMDQKYLIRIATLFESQKLYRLATLTTVQDGLLVRGDRAPKAVTVVARKGMSLSFIKAC